jgi:uncharacterized protein (TIGR02453 family)
MKFFDENFTNYFQALAANNNTMWFDQNRKWYEKSVKSTFYEFIDELVIKLRKIDPEINIMPEDAIYRINNDIRFTKEKIPYKTWMKANISPYGKKVKDYPGFYILMNHQHIIITGGSFQSEKQTLTQIRNSILRDPKGFRAIIDHPKFIETFGRLEGEYNKQIPLEYREVSKICPEIALKQFYFKKELPVDLIFDPNLTQLICQQFEQAADLHRFLCNALRSVHRLAA